MDSLDINLDAELCRDLFELRASDPGPTSSILSLVRPKILRKLKMIKYYLKLEYSDDK